MDRFGKLWFRYRQFGGWRLVREYWRMGLVWLVAKSIMKCAVERKPFKTIYSVVTAQVDGRLKERYGTMVNEPVDELSSIEPSSERKVWFCWMQGLESAPMVVRMCYESLCRNITDREIVVVTESNWRELVELPLDIVMKYENGIIPHAHFTDLIRLELLARYGGTWIDSTVLMTDPSLMKDGEEQLKEILNADLFFFQYRKKKDEAYRGISNWFISASAGNRLLRMLQKMLYQYWRDYDCVVEYFVFHLFFGMIAEKWPEEVLRMPYAYSVYSLYLEQRMSDKWDEQWYEELKRHACFHKLNYRVNAEAVKKEDSFHNVLTKKWK